MLIILANVSLRQKAFPGNRFAPESLKWLLLNNRPEETKRIVHMVAKFNRAIIPSAVYERINDIAKNLHFRQNTTNPYSVGDWFSQPAIRRYIALSCWIWSVPKNNPAENMFQHTQ